MRRQSTSSNHWPIKYACKLFVPVNQILSHSYVCRYKDIVLSFPPKKRYILPRKFKLFKTWWLLLNSDAPQITRIIQPMTRWRNQHDRTSIVHAEEQDFNYRRKICSLTWISEPAASSAEEHSEGIPNIVRPILNYSTSSNTFLWLMTSWRRYNCRCSADLATDPA